MVDYLGSSNVTPISRVAELDAALVEAAAEAANTGAPKIDLASGAVTILSSPIPSPRAAAAAVASE
jgi:hypothetical protein